MLRLTGVPTLIVEGRGPARLSDKTFCMIALVILRFRGIADRDGLASLLWEDNDGPAARVNLRNLLSRLKSWQSRSGLRLLEWDAARVWRSPACETADIDLLLSAKGPDGPGDVSRLDHSYSGPLLLGRGPEIGLDLSSWIDEQAVVLREQFIRLAIAVPPEFAGVRAILRRLSTEAPLDERVSRALMVAASLDSRNAVDLEYRRLAASLAQEVGHSNAPELETSMLATSLGASVASPIVPERASRKERPGLPRILILPPGDDSARPGVDKLAGSLIDDVTFGLCRHRTFAVIAPHTAREIGRNPAQRRAVADVDYVLLTRVLPGVHPGEYRLGFSLARCDTGEVLLGDHLRFSLSDLPSHYADLSRLVVSLIAGEIERRERRDYRMHRSPNAYVYYLMGQERLRSVDLPDLRAARRAFRHALEAEPHFAPAMSMIARTLSLEWFILNKGDDSLLAESRRMARMAVECDPLDPGGYRELGNAALYSQDLDSSLHFAEEARGRAPHHADVLLDHADSLVHNSRYREAKDVMDEAMALNPLAPDEYKWVQATIRFFLRDFQGALRIGSSMTSPEPIGRLLAMSAHLAGDVDTAKSWHDRMVERHPDFRVADWAKMVPLRNVSDRKFVEDAMRGAGFA